MFSIDDKDDTPSRTEDYICFHNTEGKGSKVEKLPGRDDLGAIEDLLYFSRKLITCLRVPASYLDLGDNKS